MDFLERNEICEWAEQRGLLCASHFDVQLPVLPSKYRAAYANGRRSGREGPAAEDLVAGLGSWDECLVRISEWGVWPSGEDWPTFYAWRGALGERRSLETAPGHRFDHPETRLLVELITLIMENAWDADILCSIRGCADKVRGTISHDEWFELFGQVGELGESAG